MAHLRISLRNTIRWSFSLSDHESRIGRSRENDIILEEPEVSRHHAIITKGQEGYLLINKSNRGTRVNQKKVHTAPLSPGDIIQIGPYQLLFEIKDLPSEETTDPAGRESTMPLEHGGEEEQTLPSLILSVVTGPDTGKKIPLRQGITQIGRSPQSTLILSDKSVSHLHAQIELKGGEIHLRDMGSTNGTYLNGRRVWEVLLTPGSEIMMGKTLLALNVEKRTSPTHPEQGLGGLMGISPPMQEVYRSVRKAAGGESTVVIQGETGTGKEIAARTIHTLSGRRQEPFIAINCASIPRELIESELFGHERGAFTTALSQRKGAFEIAGRGTLFLDEIGELPLEMQPKLLRVLEEKEFKRVGGQETLLSHCRIIAATNRWLPDEVRQGTFRADLFFRLYVFPLFLPPLRERIEDIPILVRHFLQKNNMARNRNSISISEKAMEKLMAYSWPGNVRELKNLLERTLVNLDGEVIQEEDLLFIPFHTKKGGEVRWEDRTLLPESCSLEELERIALIRALRSHNGDKKRAAKTLGIALSTLYEKIKKYGIT